MMMIRCTLRLAYASCFLFLCLPRDAQTFASEASGQTRHTVEDDDARVIVEAGAATSWTVTGGAATFAPNLAAEITPSERWLELEAGVSYFRTHDAREWDVDLLFKKPWTLSRKAEFMLGVGPQCSHLKQSGRTSDTMSAEIAGDFMFWPSGRHRFGWYLEPAYDYSFAGGHPQSLGMTAGLLIGFR